MKRYLSAISILASAFVTIAQISTTKEKIRSNSDPVGQFSADRFEVIEYPDAIETIASAINTRGDIVGRIDLPGGKVVGFVLRKKKFELIEVPGAEFTMARGINNYGHIVGATRRAGGRNTGYILKDGAFTSFTFPGAGETQPFQINSKGDAVGSYSLDGRQHGFLRRRTGEFLSLDYPGSILTYATGINDRGEIVGRWDSADGREHGFHWLDGVFKILDVPDAVQTLPDAINNRSDVVGRAIMADGRVLGFYRREGVFQTFTYPGANRTVARGVNDNGDIVGPFKMPDGKSRGFVLRANRVDEITQRIDHLVYATPDLDRGIAEIEKLLGVRATPGGKHPGRGTKNAFIALGPNSFLEIVAPDPDQPPAQNPRPFFKSLTKSRLVRWFINSRDVGHDRDDALTKGVPYGEVKPGSRQRPDGIQVSWQFTDPAKPVADGVVPFIIEWGDTPHPSHTAAIGATLISLRAEHPDPRYAKRLLLALGLKLPVKKANRPALIATIEGPRGRVELK